MGQKHVNGCDFAGPLGLAEKILKTGLRVRVANPEGFLFRGGVWRVSFATCMLCTQYQFWKRCQEKKARARFTPLEFSDLKLGATPEPGTEREERFAN
jgi:hypothetical protein